MGPAFGVVGVGGWVPEGRAGDGLGEGGIGG
jgi:hypothetical protein